MFEELALYPGLQSALTQLKFERPTDVQSQTIPFALEGKDMQVCARTGTGKTLAYLIPVIQRLVSTDMRRDPGVLALILSPTRELARQIFKLAESLCGSTPLNCQLVTGGESIRFQAAELRKDPEIVIATPGRLLELMESRSIDLGQVRLLVLDEADRVLEMGFGEDVAKIAACTPTERQTLMLSATLSGKGLGGLTRELLRNPIKLDMTTEQKDTIRHVRLLSDDRHHRNQQLIWLLRHRTYHRALVFANTRQASEQLFTLLRAQTLRAGVLHGEKDHEARKRIMNQFRQGSLDILVASDVAARGLDIPEVELVINFDLPRRGDDYRHRVGRTGRAGREGEAISLVEPGEWNQMVNLQRYLNLDWETLLIEELPGKFRGPKKVKKSGKTVGKKSKKKAAGKKTPTARKKSAPTKTSSGPAPDQPLRRKR